MTTQIPTTMQAVILTGNGGFDKLQFRTDYPTPKPKADEVLIKVSACGLNNTDINTRTAWYDDTSEQDQSSHGWGSVPLKFPRIQGADVAGEICAVGQNVNSSRIGERVLIDPWLLGITDWCNPDQSGFFGSECDGGFAQYTTVRSGNALAVNSSFSDAELATFPCAYVTAENLIAKTRLSPGETVVISGASGGVGTAAIQLCKLRGARVIAIASKSKSEQLIALGAEAVIDRAEDQLEQAIRDAAQSDVHVALDVVGGAMFTPLLKALRHGGRYSSCGAISYHDVQFDLRQLIYKDLQLTGATIVPATTFARLVKLIEAEKLKPMLAMEFALKDLVKAQQAFIDKQFTGNIVVRP